ncbi:hypothetical protein [Sulfitobacter sp. R18_1]|uniref:hypothetical protein n=1 Tax=Sulfitobacter sp. R18_1 TaxID=2821104 RepID=UPI001AD9BD0F|nr:hypothetical protein [Sulfitobacter sp. R18_1]MBO9427958.1 hypothetical protein [Sulfitobacter sp. R18_1]
MKDTVDTPVDLTEGTLPKDADARFEELNGSCVVIPKGHYCYTALGFKRDEAGGPPRMRIKACPYHAVDPDQPEQRSGYCAKLKAGDWEEEGTRLLWDMTKECDVNYPDWEEDDELEADLQKLRTEVSGET